MFCQMVFISNNNFLISKQNKTLKIDTKMLTGIAIFRHALSSTQTDKAL